MASIPIHVATPGAGAGAYPALLVGTAHRREVARLGDADASWFGALTLPAGSAMSIIVSLSAALTAGAARLEVSSAAIAATESLNPAALTAEAAQTATVPATARARLDVRFPAAGSLTPALVAGDLLLVQIRRIGTDAADTLAGAIDIEAAILSYTPA